MGKPCWVWILGLAIASAAPAATGEKEIARRWQGAWVVTGVPTQSDCAGRYTNNELHGDLVSSSGIELFPAGELARVEKINLTRRRLEVFLDLDEPILRPRREGPFELYDEVFCRVELRIPRPRGDDEAVEIQLAASVERHATRESALASRRYNGRRRAPWPAGYEATLAEYERWKVEQANLAVGARLDESLDRAARLSEHIGSEPEYLQGFAAGVERARHRHLGSDCHRLLDTTVGRFVERAAKEKSSHWADGYDDGQKLYFHLEMARRLRGCFLPLPG